MKKYIKDIIATHKWVLGATNYDEDIHFSSYYIRASYNKNTKSFYNGYSKIFAFYHQFTEKYYLIEDECISNAKYLIARSLEHPEWLPFIIDQIIAKSELLKSIFSDNIDEIKIKAMSTSELLNYYQLHDYRQSDLYQYARIPEVLDRGIGFFTQYLKNYLSSCGVHEAQLEETFNTLTNPTKPSILSEELMNFINIVSVIRKSPTKDLFLNNTSHTRLFLEPELINMIEKHMTKWRYLLYHGYGNRRLSGFNDYLERIKPYLFDDSSYDQIQSIKVRLKEANKIKEELFLKYKISSPYKKLFTLYPTIGRIKLFRRYVQLRNFYYLDILLSEISQRLEVPEFVIRHMMPEEIINNLVYKKKISKEIYDRARGVAIMYNDQTESLIKHPEYLEIEEFITSKTKEVIDKKVLKGIVACKGNVVGTCKIVIRPNEDTQSFAKGNILVSESTDPDLINYLKIAGGVLTEQGGVTSHAAIICRELGIPTIIGVSGLLNALKDGDIVELDANSGIIKIQPGRENLSNEIINLFDSTKNYPVGLKAVNLEKLLKLGYNVPDFLIFPFLKPEELELINENDLISYIKQMLNIENNDYLILRSNSNIEDQISGSLAGEFESLPNIKVVNILGGLKQFIDINRRSKTNLEYQGTIIIQKLIFPDYSGVCLTSSYNAYGEEFLVLELKKGGNFEITSGAIKPTRVIYNTKKLEIDDEKSQLEIDFASISDINDIITEFINIRNRFNSELDIEWAIKGKKLICLQVRPIMIAQKTSESRMLTI